MLAAIPAQNCRVIENGERKIDRWTARHGVAVAEWNSMPHDPFFNANTPEELEEEDRAAKSAKLQELIRRGNPRDLAAAQELMKYLAGAVSLSCHSTMG